MIKSPSFSDNTVIIRSLALTNLNKHVAVSRITDNFGYRISCGSPFNDYSSPEDPGHDWYVKKLAVSLKSLVLNWLGDWQWIDVFIYGQDACSLPLPPLIPPSPLPPPPSLPPPSPLSPHLPPPLPPSLGHIMCMTICNIHYCFLSQISKLITKIILIDENY